MSAEVIAIKGKCFVSSDSSKQEEHQQEHSGSVEKGEGCEDHPWYHDNDR